MRNLLIITFVTLVMSIAARAQNNVPQGQVAPQQRLAAPSAVAAPVTPVAPNAKAAPDATAAGVPGVPVIPPAQSAAPTPAPVVNTDPLLEGFFEDLQYSPTDKRDPFLPYYVIIKQRLGQENSNIPLEPLQKFALGELKIVGIIWDVGHPKALVLDPAGKSHIITENAKLGKDMGYVAAIREGEIIVVEPIQDNEGKKGYQTKVLKLTKQM